MRQVEFKKRAVNAIEAVCDFIEGKNTPGSSANWYYDLVDFTIKHANIKLLKFPLCYHQKFAEKGFSCFIFKREWIIVFKYSGTKLIVYRFVHGSKLK